MSPPPHTNHTTPKPIAPLVPKNGVFKKITAPGASPPSNKVWVFTQEARGMGWGGQGLTGASKEVSGAHGRRRRRASKAG